MSNQQDTSKVSEYKLSSLKVGQSDSVLFLPSQELLNSYVHVSGDASPLHTDKDFCCSLGLRDVVVHGLFTASAVSRFVGMVLPGRYAKLLQVNLSWPNPVFVNDEILLTGTIVEISEATKTIQLKVTAKNEQKKTVMKGLVLVGVDI